MKLVRADKERFTFSLTRGEKSLLFEILKAYPLVPSAHYRLSKEGKWPAHLEDQRMLEEALAAQRRENRERIVAMLEKPGHFQENGGGVELSLASEEMNWLLEVLNDLRVGAWLALGEPGELALAKIDKTNARYAFTLDVAGAFQSNLLAALGFRERKSWGEG